jgi:hypothetical protein
MDDPEIRPSRYWGIKNMQQKKDSLFNKWYWEN